MHSMKYGAAAGVALLALSAQAAEWSDTSIGLSRGMNFKSPGSDVEVSKSIISLTHVSGYSLGTNFFNVDMLKSDRNEPASNNSRSPAQEVYVVYGHTLSLGKLTKKPMALGPIRDVGIYTGFDFSSKNDAFSGSVLKVLVGPKVDLDVPGLLQVALLYKKEIDNNSITGVRVHYDDTYRVAVNWAFNFGLGLPAVFKGWGTYTGKMGKDGFGGPTAPETWIETALMWDVGSLAGKDKTFYAGVGYQFIRNKFSVPSNVPGTRISAPMLKVEAHF